MILQQSIPKRPKRREDTPTRLGTFVSRTTSTRTVVQAIEAVVPERGWNVNRDTIRQSIECLQKEGRIAGDAANRWEDFERQMPKVGDVFLDFELIKELGRGGFGTVFLARQASMAGRLVAIKLSADLFGETQTLAQLQHTNIMPVYSAHRTEALQAVVMPYYGATTLADIYQSIRNRETIPESGRYLVSTLESRRITVPPSSVPAPSHRTSDQPVRPLFADFEPRETPAAAEPHAASASIAKLLEQYEGLSYVDAVLWLGQRIALGLAHAHERGIIHRDLKPANILLTDEGEPMLLDFNLAEDTKDKLRQLVRGGTLPYMSPEQLGSFAGEKISLDARTDIYSLGLILHQLLTGHCIYNVPSGPLAETLPAMRAARLKMPTMFENRSRDVTPAVAAIIRKCVQISPEDRYQSAANLAEDIERHRQNLPLKYAVDPSRRERCRKWMRRNPKLVSPSALIGMSAAVALVATTLVVNASYEARKRELARNIELGQQKIREFETGSGRSRQYLTANLNEPTWVATGLRQGMKALDGIGASHDPNWLQQPEFAHLTDDAKSKLKAKAEELSYFISLTGVGLTGGAAVTGDGSHTAEIEKYRERLREMPLLAEKRPFLKAVELQAAGNYRESLSILEKLERESPEVAEYRFLMGRAYQMTMDYPKAYQAFSVCIALKPEFGPGYFNRALVGAKMNIPQVRLDIDKAVELEPMNSEVRLLQSQILGKARQYDAAAKALDIVCDRVHPPVWGLLARAHLNQLAGNKDAASRDRDLGMAGHPAEYRDYMALGFARMKSEPQQALADFEAAERLAPNMIEPLQDQAYIEGKLLKHPERAIAILQRLLKRNPDFHEGRDALAVYLARTGQSERALEIVAKMLAGEPSQNARYQAGCVYALLAKQEPKYALPAVKQIALALEKGFGFDYLPIDGDLDPIRQQPDFKILSDYVKATRQLKKGD